MAALSRVLPLEQGLVTSRPTHGLAGLCLTTPAGHWPVRRYLPCGFGLFPVRSPLLREWSLFLGVLRCFSSPGSLSDIRRSAPVIHRSGLPHSEIPG
jgi:hypothetical protein